MATWKIILFVLVILWLLCIVAWIVIEFIRGNDVRIYGKGEYECDTFILDGELFNYQYDGGVLHIEESWKVSKKSFGAALADIREKHPEMPLWKRSDKSLKAEWATHNLLYRWGWWKTRTKDVDLDYRLSFSIEMAYFVAGAMAYLFIK